MLGGVCGRVLGGVCGRVLGGSVVSVSVECMFKLLPLPSDHGDAEIVRNKPFLVSPSRYLNLQTALATYL